MLARTTRRTRPATPDAAANGDGNPNGPNPDPDGATSDGAKDGGFDATKKDGDTDTDGAVLDDGGRHPWW